MINNTESKKVYEVQSGVTEYPIGFPFHFNADQTPQLSVVIGDDVLQLNYNCRLSEDKGTLILIPTEEEAENLIGPDDYSWMDKWVGDHLVIERDIPCVQESDYQLGRISAEQIEHDFDASVMRDQMLAEEIGKHTVDVQAEVDAINARIDGVQQEHAEDKADIDAALATKATKTELENAETTLNVGIQGNTQAIKKTRDDYQAADQSIRADMNAKDSELETILNDHTNRLNTLRTDHDDLGDDVSDIQAKIPQSASGSNPLVTKQQLLDEEMDIREDVNSGLSEVQTQITAQAAAIAKKAEKDSVYTKEQVDAKVSSVYKVKGSVANYDSLPTDASIGDVYDTLDSGANYVWTESGWDKLGDIVDLTDYAKKEELDGYLPLTGGELSGSLDVYDRLYLSSGTYDRRYSIVASLMALHITELWTGKYLSLSSGNITAYGSIPRSLGSSSSPWTIIHTQSLNNGAAIAVPTEGGTLARIEDINAIGGEGTTGQVLTKTDDGFAWQDSAGGATGDYLPLDGGTMTGGITRDVGFTEGTVEVKHKLLDFSGGIDPWSSGSYVTPKLNIQYGPSWNGGGGTLYLMHGTTNYGLRMVIFESNINFSPNVNSKGSLTKRYKLGQEGQWWDVLYTRYIHAPKYSSDPETFITVPAKTGTMALVEDIDAALGDISTALTAIIGE